MRVLGIESSCDETGLALYDTERGLLAHAVHSQVDMHKIYGGVVPELASRDHIRRLIPLLTHVLTASGCTRQDINAIAYTAGPGLAGALLVGASFAEALGQALNIPTLPVHHLEGHLLSPLLAADAPEFPFIALLVSGGHTQLMRVTRVGDYELLGESLDDAAGEAFDKVARYLGLGYPGGPAIDAISMEGDPQSMQFPRAMLNEGYDFSFSGLKTSVVNHVRRNPEVHTADVAAAFQEAVVDVLVTKARRAARDHGAKGLCLAGGVAANSLLRERLLDACVADGLRAFLPSRAMCTDNAAMVAAAGWYRLQSDGPSPLDTGADPNLKLVSTLS